VHRRLTLAVAVVTALLAVTVAPRTASAAVAPVTKLLVVVEENHSLAQMKSGMPYTFSLASSYGYATSYGAITHPSLPNYLAIAGGSTFGVTDDRPPPAHPIAGQSVFGQAWSTGHTARTYAESATSNCQLTSTGGYAVRHNPWPYFTDPSERSSCRSDDVPFTAFAGDVASGLPTIGLVVPNVCNDAHDCSLATADGWFRALMQSVFAGPDWRAGRLAVVLTADESGHGDATNTVLTVVIHPSQHGHVVSVPLTHYSLTGLIDDVLHAPPLRGAASAPSMAAAFGLPIG
jgi:acid phosphatase